MARNCIRRCPKCPGTSTPVSGDGPRDASVICIGEAPGKDERAGGRPFIGKAGKEFNEHYLTLAGLRRSEIYVTNTVKCWWANSGEAPPDDLADSCADFHLRRELDEIQPNTIVLMGAFALKTFRRQFTNWEHDLFDLDIQHGMPVVSEGTAVVPMYHPASGMHDTKRMKPLREDFKRLRQIIAGTYVRPVDAYPRPDYREITNEQDLKHILNRDYMLPLAIDTESVPGEKGWQPWCLTFSNQPGTGYMLRKTAGPAVFESFNGYVQRWRGKIYMHYALHDKGPLAQLGVHVPWRRVRDTMSMAYHRGLQQGLKTLSYRLLGVRQREFEDVVMPVANELMWEYLMEATTRDWPKPDADIVWDDKKQDWKIYKPHGMNTKLKVLWTNYQKKQAKGETVDLFDKWDNWSAEEHAMIEAELGRYPKPSIALVPLQEAIVYACADADLTLRNGGVMERMRIRR